MRSIDLHFQSDAFIQPQRHGQIRDKVNIFKRSKAVFCSEFSISWTGCQTKAKQPNLRYDFPIAGKTTGFPEGISQK